MLLLLISDDPARVRPVMLAVLGWMLGFAMLGFPRSVVIVYPVETPFGLSS